MTELQRILVVEDQEETVLFISQILENHNYEYSVARNGEEALEAMKADPPSLVLLDVMMPRKSGLNVYQQMKKDRNLEKIPIIIVTGASQATGVDMTTGVEDPKESYGDEFARGIGAVIKEKLDGISPEGFIEKPIDPSVLMAKVKQLLP
ncbi:MAG: response regulator [Candidatus Latescibacterota bacterium]|nr:MAG: response regulator [Candidatus Latescibacterota bacterium]